MKVDYAKKIKEVEEEPLDILKDIMQVSDKSEWHPEYEWAGVWARQFIKTYAFEMIPYIIWGLVFSFTYYTGHYPALIISSVVAILYSIRRIEKKLK